MRTYLKGALILVVLAVTILWAGNRYAAKHGADSEKLKQGIEQTKQGEKQLAHYDTVFVHDTVRLTREVSKYKLLRDSLVITDTVTVREFVKQADSTIKACLLTVQTCEQKDSAHKVIESGLRRQNDALKALVPTRTEKLITATKWTLLGALIGVAYSHK